MVRPPRDDLRVPLTELEDTRRYDAGKKIDGRKRHIAVDAIGLLLTVLITAAGLQDRDAAEPLLWNLKRRSPRSGLPGPTAATPASSSPGRRRPQSNRADVRRPDDLHTFQVLPRRWVVERALAWITRCRRTVRDYERLLAHHETVVYGAMIITMSRRLARPRQAPQPSSPQ
jgi:transposase